MSLRSIGADISRHYNTFMDTVQNDDIIDWPLWYFLVPIILIMLVLSVLRLVFEVFSEEIERLAGSVHELSGKADWNKSDGALEAVKTSFWASLFVSAIYAIISALIIVLGVIENSVSWGFVLDSVMVVVALFTAQFIILVMFRIGSLLLFGSDEM